MISVRRLDISTPLSHWIWFHLAVFGLLAAEYGMAQVVTGTHRKAIIATGMWVAAALVMAGLLVRSYQGEGATQFLAGYALEEALSIDNLFVFLLLFKLFRIPDSKQGRVLFWGVLGAIVLRGAFIAAGIGLLERFHWVEYVFAAVLLVAAVRLVIPKNEATTDETPRWLLWLTRWQPISESQEHFFVREAIGGPASGSPVRWMATVLFLALVAVELTDIIFAMDSIPAVLSITRQPFLAYTSNIMAVMGLRSLYVLLAAMLSKLRFLHFGLAAVLAFAAAKMLLSDFMTIGPVISLAVIAGLLALTIGVSLLRPGYPQE